ncbi:MAG TPA: radical SAM family heme chaperone HemW [Gammaproteobacteria bacterium]
MLDFKHSPPLALYIHIPWCVKKCPYCDFNSHVSGSTLPETHYVEALLADLEFELPKIWGREIISVFIGGGTPSLFSAGAIDDLLSGLRARLNLLPNIEITLEANPGTVEQGRFNEFRSCGINRLSIGVQSFQESQLKNLGRIHGKQEAMHAVEAAKLAGFDSINIDLMYGLPQQGADAALSDLESAISLEPDHISHYQLTIEPDTAFHHRPPTLPNDDRIWDMQLRCQARLAEAGYTQYEISAYAREGHQCIHNLNYWHFGDYVGIGAGAHQKLTMLQEQQVRRSWKQRLPERYMNNVTKRTHIEGETIVDEGTLVSEFMLNALRLTAGFKPNLFYERAGLPVSRIAPVLESAQAEGLIDWTVTHIQPTARGRQFLNELLLKFID